jgi:hypothetical protein
MIKIPDNVEDWDIGLIAKLIHEGYDENEILEFKSEINEQTKKIPITACAFANTHGGTMILGINNDRRSPLSFDQRLIGLEDSDDLKSKITNQLKNIKPDILISNIVFKESNIKLLNGKVIIILQVLKSKNAPHQYENKFYKRISNGNTEMDIEEIRKSFIDSLKNERLMIIISQECGFLRTQLKMISDSKRTPLSALMKFCKDLRILALDSFLLDHAYLYDYEVQESILRIIEAIHKLNSMPEFSDLFIQSEEEIKKTENMTAEEFMRKRITSNADRGLLYLEKLEKSLDWNFIDATSLEELDSETKNNPTETPSNKS